jgi:hypothetical protein
MVYGDQYEPKINSKYLSFAITYINKNLVEVP